MNFCEEQKREIETIKERIVKLELSDADCERISRKAGISGLTVSELLENFIGDLVNGTYSMVLTNVIKLMNGIGVACLPI